VCERERERERVVGKKYSLYLALPHFPPLCFVGQVLRESKDSKGQKQMWLKREQADALTSDSK
jgi:hypothetical protein